MSKARFNRRQFLESTGRTLAGSSLTAYLPAIAAADLKFEALDDYTATVLVRVCRVVFPHDDLNDSYYANCVESLDRKAVDDGDLAALLDQGIKELDATPAGRFLEMDEAGQAGALRAVEDTPFFNAVQGHLVVALYNNPKVWPHFGYEGASYPFGGYLERGFDDIDWLPRD